MPKREVRQVGSFVAVDDAGKRHSITTYQEFVEVLSLNKGHEGWLGGLKSHKMSNGNHVNENGDGTLEEVATGLKMRRLTGGRRGRAGMTGTLGPTVVRAIIIRLLIPNIAMLGAANRRRNGYAPR